VETVLWNRDDFVEIGKRVSRVSTLLSQLEDTKMADEPAMRGALEKLLATFRRTHTLVVACQRRGLAIAWLSTAPPHLVDCPHSYARCWIRWRLTSAT
jgi:hypothetical protein